MKREGKISRGYVLNRIARIMGVVFTIFISLFALDVFESGRPFAEILLALFMHLVPTCIILIILWVAWKWPLVGGILFITIGIIYLVLSRGQFLPIAAIPATIGVLFLVSHRLMKSNSD